MKDVTVNEQLWLRFTRRWMLNQNGGCAARVARVRVLHWLALQKLGFHRWVEARLFFGEKMWVLTGEPVSSGLLGFGYAESALTALMLKVLRRGMCVVDVGAHLGYEALLGSILVGDSGKVISFEPQPKINSWTIRNLKRFPQTRIVKSAVGDYDGSVQFSELSLLDSAFSGFDIKTSAPKINVPVTRLSRALSASDRPVDFIKCDVEGAEMAVLRGALDIIKLDQPILVLEAEMPNESNERPRVIEFNAFLSPLGYQAVSFDFDGDLKLSSLGSLREGHANVAFFPKSKLDNLPLEWM